LEVPLREVETVKSGPGLDALREAAPDILAVVAYGEILPREVLALPTMAPVNLHFSLLPKLRGAAPVQRAILNGLDRTGVTTIRMDEGMDTGPILLQIEEEIGPQEDAGSLGDRLAATGGRLLVQTLDGLESGTIREQPQDDAAATLAPKLKPEDRIIDWSRSAEDIVGQVRALAPDPGAVTIFGDRRVKVLRVSPRATIAQTPEGVDPRTWPPGRPFGTAGGGWGMVAGNGMVTLEEVQPEGRRRMTGADFVRGYFPRPSRPDRPPGERPARG
jgi:methionyl-tRNA formyltransferase